MDNSISWALDGEKGNSADHIVIDNLNRALTIFR